MNRSFTAEASAVGSTVTTALLRMNDLTVAARAIIASEPTLSNRTLANWYEGIGATRRYPGIMGFGYIKFVPAGELSAFIAELRHDPIPGLAVGHGPLKLLTSGPRPYYCLARFGVAAALNQFVPTPGVDFCSIPGFTALQEARDSGQFVAFTLGGRIFAEFAPVYRGGITPLRIGLRRTRIIGVVAELFDVKTILSQALAGHPDLQIEVARHVLDSTAQVTSAVARQFATSVGMVSAIAGAGSVGSDAMRRQLTVDADGRWTVTISKSPEPTLLTPDVQALVMLTGGAIVSALAFLLILTLSRGRVRALRAVEHRTAQLRHQALHDSLTGLPNRELLAERAEELLDRGRRDNLEVAAMFMDIDGFKGVNDTYGHLAGDELLRTVAERIARTLRSTDTVGRIAGDEFVVLAGGRDRSGGPELLAERLLDALRVPFEIGGPDGVLLSITASIGVAVGGRANAEELMRDADIALYRAKTTGKNRFVVFRPEMRLALQGRVSLENDLRRAIANDELRLLYQPTFELRSGRVIEMEALLRWEHPTRGLLAPAEFIPIAEESGLIVEMGTWAIRGACEQAAEWQTHNCNVGISVNVSVRQLDDPGLLQAVQAGLRRTGIAPAALTLELTETALMRDSSLIATRLQALKHLGVRVAIDDFGTGYSSLAYLHQFPVDALKIDRGFMSTIPKLPETKALIRTLLQLAASLGVDTIAEGIENEAQLRFLISEGCRCGQGFLLSPPMEPQAARSFLDQRAGPANGTAAALAAQPSR